MSKIEGNPCAGVDEVHKEELISAIRSRRAFWDDLAKKSGKDLHYPDASEDDLVGLALSGGGIRSAMYNLGLLQAFEESGLMKHVDYMASVSGGGYTNGFYSLHHSETLEPLEHQGTAGNETDKQTPIPGATHAMPGTSSQSKKSQTKLTAGSREILHRSKKLAINTEKFLLHGQYLNRPIEFMASYIFRTLVMSATVLSLVVACASAIAILFRYFDEPRVRVWLGLLDLDSDLRVGLFSCGLVAVAILAVRAIVLWCMRVRERPLRTNPGQPALIVLASFLLGISIMIGNGDFAVSQGTGWLPQKIDLKSLQWPIIILIVLAFSPLLKLPSLLRSERANATMWQKFALSIVLCCTTWGTAFALVGWIGQENVSGFATNRPPKFHRYDIKNYAELAGLLQNAEPNENSELNAKRKVDDLSWLIVDADGKVKVASNEILGFTQTKNAAEQRLRSENLKWHSWWEPYNACLSRYLQVVGASILTVKSNVQDVVHSERSIYSLGPTLTDALDKSISNGIATQPESIAARSESGKLASKDWEAISSKTQRLLDLVAMRIVGLPKEISGLDMSALVKKEHLESGNLDEHDIQSVVGAWIAKGGKLLYKGGVKYRDLDAFHSLTEKAWLNREKLDFSGFTELEFWRLNRMCLEVAYPRVFKERAWVSTSVVVREDQWFRLVICFWSFAIHVLCVFLLDMNWTCAWFHFYKARVHATFLQGGNHNIVPLKSLKPHMHGAPYPLFVAGMVVPQIPNYIDESSKGSDVGNPSKLDGSYASDWYSFMFSPLYCGWLPCRNTKMATYLPTEKFWDKRVGVEDAVVLSGAAVTPWMSANTSLQFLMHLFNFRLEQWVPNTMLPQPTNRRFSLIDMAREFWTGRLVAAGDSPTENCRYVVVADGGFREFLGVEELVARRCRVIIVSDAGCNNGLFEFGVLADLIRKLRLDHGIQVLDLDQERPLDTRRLRRTEELENKSPQHFVLGRIRYPERRSLDGENVPKEALLVYVQMSLTGDEDIDIEQFRKTNPNFPDEPISNQFYSREQVESFRQLGEHIGRLLCRDISDFDCTGSTGIATVGKAQVNAKSSTLLDLQDERIRRLEDAFRSSYRAECRQEGFIADDDARIGWILDKQVKGSTLATVHAYESDSNHRRQLVVRDYVWAILDGVPMESHDHIQPADLYGIAVECNRRHAGFRPEWPTSYFQVGGRDLLIKAAQIADETFSAIGDDKEFEEWCKGNVPEHTRAPLPIQKLCRLAVMLPRAVFRKSGSRTSAEVLVCMLARAMFPNRDFELDRMQWISCEKAQSALRSAIRTGKASEVEGTINNLVRLQKPKRSPDAPTRAATNP